MSVITVTPNAALDITYYVYDFQPGRVYRVSSVIKKAGGKGINVARAVRTLGLDPLATGFAGGPTGELILNELLREGIRARFVTTVGGSRSTITIVDEATGVITELREPGEPLSSEELARFLGLFEEICREISCDGTVLCEGKPFRSPRGGGILEADEPPAWLGFLPFQPRASRNAIVLSGSLRPGLGADFYAKLIGVGKTFGCLTILDTAGEALRYGVAAGPYLVRVNLTEAQEFFETEQECANEMDSGSPLERAAGYASRIAACGPEIVVVSMGNRGAIMLYRNNIWFGNVTIDNVQNPVGSGDSMAGGMASALAAGCTVLDAFRLGIACGAANALTASAAEFRLEDVKALFERVEVRSYGSCDS